MVDEEVGAADHVYVALYLKSKIEHKTQDNNNDHPKTTTTLASHLLLILTRICQWLPSRRTTYDERSGCRQYDNQ